MVLCSLHFMFSGDVLTASRCGSAQTVTYFLPFFSLSFALSNFLCFSLFLFRPSFLSVSFCLSFFLSLLLLVLVSDRV